MIKIYYLYDPADGRPRYVGKTSQRLGQRLRNHLADAKRMSGSNASGWIRDLLAAGSTPRADLIALVDGAAWETQERYWIDAFRKRFPGLLNLSPGGDGPLGFRDYDPKPKEIARQRHLEAVRQPEFRKAAGERTRKRFEDPAFRERFGQMIAARSQQPGYREHQSTVRKVKWANAGYKAAQLAKRRLAKLAKEKHHGIEELRTADL